MFRSWLFARRPSSLVLHRINGFGSHQPRPRFISDDEFTSARAWLLNFTQESIPKHLWKVTYSRSSGPGGQHVNKVNSKATLRVSVGAILPHVPQLIHSAIRESTYYAPKSDSLVLSNDESRSQGQNAEHCYKILYELIRDLAEERIPGETSESQKQKVSKLKVDENEKRLKFKKKQSQKKAMRSFRRDD